MRTVALALLLAPSVALAVPMTLNHQGRLADASGAPLSGSHTLDITLWDAAASGSELWSETITTDFDGGYFSIILGEIAPLTTDALSGNSVFLGLAVDGNPEITPRPMVNSVPYAILATSADTATNVSGGTVDATSIAINGTTLIDSTGKLDWSAIENAPADNDLLATLTCNADGQTARWDGSAWACSALNAADVGALDSGTTAADIGGLAITGGTLTGSLAGTDADFTGNVTTEAQFQGQLAEGNLTGRLCPQGSYLSMGYCLPKGEYIPREDCADGGTLRNGVCYSWPDPQCQWLNIANARTTCSDLGARMCTVAELDRLDGTGCGQDLARAWAYLGSDTTDSVLQNTAVGLCFRRQSVLITSAGGTPFIASGDDDIASCLAVSYRAPTTDSAQDGYVMCCHDEGAIGPASR